MKWPYLVKRRNKVLATIYKKTDTYPFYRVVYRLDGKRMMKSFAKLNGDEGAKAWADTKADELAKGSKAAALTAKQADDALAALKHLHRFNSHRPEALIHPSGIASPNAFMVKAYPSKAPFLHADCRLMTIPCQSECKNDTELDAIRLDATGGQDN